MSGVSRSSRSPAPVRPRVHTRPESTATPSTPKTRSEDSVDRSGRAGATTTVTTSTTNRAAGVSVRNLTPIAQGVELGRNGLVVDGESAARDAGVTRGSVGVLYEAARRTTLLDEPAFKSLTAAQRTRLVDQLTPFLLFDRESSSKDGSTAVKSRAASFALLSQLCASMKSTEKSRSELAAALVQAASVEKHPGLRRQMILGVEGLPPRALKAADVKLRDALVSEMAPPTPPYEKWFGASKEPVFRVRQYVMGEFFRGELAAYRKAGFDVEESAHGRAVATKMLVDPEGKNPPVKATVELFERDDNVFDAMSDPKIHAVIYSGHSQLGAVGKLSMEDAPKMRGDKLVAMFACRTKQNLPSLRQTFPGAHLLVSNSGTYGHDDRIVTAALFDGIAKRASYAAIEKAAEKGGPWEKNNYIFPHDKEQWQHIDHDRDGAADVSGARRDVLFDVDIAARRGASISFKPAKDVPELSTLDGKKIADAVAWFNTEFTYWTDDFGSPVEKKRADAFRPEGWFKGDDPSEIVRIEKSGGEHPVYRVRVNAAYAELAPDALTMMVTHELALAVTRETRPKESAYEQRMRALAMVGAYVNYHVEFSDVADHLLRKFGERFGYPPSLTWPVVEKAINSDAHSEASEKVVRTLEKGMQYPFLEVNPARTSLAFRTEVQKALDVLRDSDVPVARATFEAIVSGRVKVDCLNDLSRADFMRLRKELLPSGTTLNPEDFLRLHDDKSKAMRAITTAIDGYMWDDRVYIATGRAPKDLAATLVHEVNHVANASEDHYRTPKDALREEYRAFYCEEWLRTGKKPDAARCKEIKERVIADYDLKNVTAADVDDTPPGALLP